MVQASAPGSQRDDGPPGCLVWPNSPAPSALLELSWKFQVLSAAKKKKKKKVKFSQNFCESGKPYSGGALTTQDPRLWGNPDVTMCPHQLSG